MKGTGENDAGDFADCCAGGEDGSCSCHPTFSGGYSSGPYSFCSLGPAVSIPLPLVGVTSPFPYCRASRSSFGMPIYFDSRFDRSSLVDGVPVEPSWLTSHHLLDGLPLESDPSNASLTLILGIGDKDGMYPVHQVDSGLPNAGEAGPDPDVDSEWDCSWGPSCRAAIIEPL